MNYIFKWLLISLIIIFFHLFPDWFIFQLFDLFNQITILFKYFFIHILTNQSELIDLIRIYFLTLNILLKHSIYIWYILNYDYKSRILIQLLYLFINWFHILLNSFYLFRTSFSSQYLYFNHQFVYYFFQFY